MALPQFDIIRMDNFGIRFDPRTKGEKGHRTKSWWVTCYEFEFYPADWEDGLVLDGQLYPARKNWFTCAKPGQTGRMQLPYQCYYLNIATRDEKLKAALDALPTYAHNPDVPQIIELFKKCYKRSSSSTLSSQMERYGYVCQILGLILRTYPDAPPASPVTNVRRHGQALMEADEYLRTHLSENVDLEKLAHNSGLHPTYFHKLYTAAFGHTPTENHMRYRIRAAWARLRDDNMTIAEIARMYGFSSQSHFCRKFKRYSSQTPSQFRKSLRKQKARGATDENSHDSTL